jgi:opacity protein-like surface antigen
LQAGTSLLTYLNKKPDAIQRLNFALTGGVGYEFEKFTLDARYNYQTNDYLKDSSDANSLKINYFNIGLGYKF